MVSMVTGLMQATVVWLMTTENSTDRVAFGPKFRPITVTFPPSLVTLLTLSTTGGKV